MNRQVPCTNCGGESPALLDDSDAHDSGLILSASCIGYYNGFMDSLDSNVAYICHDCSLLMMRTMSGLAKFFMPLGAGHPMSGHDSPPCCEFAWTFGTDDNGETVLLVGTTEGTWKLSE